jgi:RNA-directed DNA polymerase
MADIAQQINPILRGWIECDGRYNHKALGPILRYVNRTLQAWPMRKFKRFMGRKTKTRLFLKPLSRERPGLFAHWNLNMCGSFA